MNRMRNVKRGWIWAAAGACLMTLTPVARAQVLISQIYGGGNNASAPFNADYIELYNTTASPINLVTAPGWRIFYASDTGTTWTASQILSGTIPANGYLLIRTQAPGTTSGADVPAP